MIQEIAPHQFHNEYRPKPPGPESYLLCYRGREALVKWKDGNLEFPRFRDLDEDQAYLRKEAQYLFSIDEESFYLLPYTEDVSPAGFAMERLDVFRIARPKHLGFAGITGAQLYRWYRSRRYCGCCGGKMRHHDKERMMYCEACNHREYPKIMPAVIVGVTNGNRLLMTKYAPNRGNARYALIAGFAEIGETLEETVKREVMEEVGLKVKNLRYYKSQPWSFSDTILMGFFADLDGEEEITLDRDELALAEWYEREEIPVSESTGSLTNEMILGFKRGLCG